jgi:hypothetical protein
MCIFLSPFKVIRSLSRESFITLHRAASVGRRVGINDTPGRLLIYVRARIDGTGWDVQGDLIHRAWQLSLDQAADYAAFRPAGYTSATRILNAESATYTLPSVWHG